MYLLFHWRPHRQVFYFSDNICEGLNLVILKFILRNTINLGNLSLPYPLTSTSETNKFSSSSIRASIMSTAADPTESGTDDEMQDEGQETSLVQDVRTKFFNFFFMFCWLECHEKRRIVKWLLFEIVGTKWFYSFYCRLTSNSILPSTRAKSFYGSKWLLFEGSTWICGLRSKASWLDCTWISPTWHATLRVILFYYSPKWDALRVQLGWVIHI